MFEIFFRIVLFRYTIHEIIMRCFRITKKNYAYWHTCLNVINVIKETQNDLFNNVGCYLM